MIKKIKEYFIAKDEYFYKTMFIIALPVVIQHIISIGLNLVDTVMIGRLGEDFLAAVGIANRIYFLFTIFCFGLYSGASVFVSQYWGVKDIKNIRKVFGIELTFGIIIAIVTSLLVQLFPHQIMSIFIDEEYVISLGIQYLRIISFSYIVTAVSFAISFNSRSVHLLKKPTIINAAAISLNTFLNYVLIYGKFGFPSLGVEGAAYATLIARSIEFILMVSVIYFDKNHPFSANFKELTNWGLPMVKRVFRTSLPVVGNEAAWGIGTTIYYIAYGMIGPEAIAVVQVAFVISDFFQSVFFGIGNASAVMVGNEIGREKFDKAYDYSKRFIVITFSVAIIMSIIYFFSRNIIIAFYGFNAVTSTILNKTIIVSAIFLTPKMLTYLIIVGILRSGGDTKFCLILEFICVWAIGIPLSFFSVLVLNLPIHLVLALVFSEELVRLAVVLKRFESKKWINNLIT
ncbi:MAG: MATE family efflux transporter [Eubacteriales bacterium]